MPLGDSITLGAGSTSLNGYRKPLYWALTGAGYNFDFVGGLANGDFPDPNHEGHSSWHADGGPDGGLLYHVYDWLTANPADIILLHIGTNDITVGGEDANEVSDILDEIDRFSTDIKVILALIIDQQTHSPATTQFNTDVNDMAQNRIAAGDDIIIVDMESALDYGTDMYDNLHPNDAGYAKMADIWFDALDSLISPHLIKFDAASSNSSSSNGNTLNWQHTIADSNERILVVGIAGEDDNVSDLVISTVTYNDVNMTLVAGSSETVSSGSPIYHMKTELYYLLDANLPSLPGNYTVTVTYNGDVKKRCAGAISLANVAQQVREAVATNSNVGQDTISTNITTQTNSAWVVDVVGCGNDGSFLTASGGMTERFDISSNSSTAAGGTKPVASAGPTTMSWSYSSGANLLAHSAAVFAPAARTISGHVQEPNETPIEDVSISADNNGGSDTTDPNGYYQMLVPYNWSGNVTPTKVDYTFKPFDWAYSNVTTDRMGQDYMDVTIYDLYSDGFIDHRDLNIISENWLSTGLGDFNNDGIVDFLDYAEFALAW